MTSGTIRRAVSSESSRASQICIVRQQVVCLFAVTMQVIRNRPQRGRANPPAAAFGFGVTVAPSAYVGIQVLETGIDRQRDHSRIRPQPLRPSAQAVLPGFV